MSNCLRCLMSNCLRCLIANRESHFANRKTFRSGRSTSVSYKPFHNRWRTFWSKCLTLTQCCYVNAQCRLCSEWAGALIMVCSAVRWATQIWNTRFAMAETQLFLGLPKTYELSAGACGRYRMRFNFRGVYILRICNFRVFRVFKFVVVVCSGVEIFAGEIFADIRSESVYHNSIRQLQRCKKAGLVVGFVWRCHRIEWRTASEDFTSTRRYGRL